MGTEKKTDKSVPQLAGELDFNLTAEEVKKRRDGTFDLLPNRQSTHGDFSLNAHISQHLKQVYKSNGYDKFTPTKRESLDMIALRIARILSGSPNVARHWSDIAGYAQLVVEELTAKPKASKEQT